MDIETILSDLIKCDLKKKSVRNNFASHRYMVVCVSRHIVQERTIIVSSWYQNVKKVIMVGKKIWQGMKDVVRTNIYIKNVCKQYLLYNKAWFSRTNKEGEREFSPFFYYFPSMLVLTFSHSSLVSLFLHWKIFFYYFFVFKYWRNNIAKVFLD